MPRNMFISLQKQRMRKLPFVFLPPLSAEGKHVFGLSVPECVLRRFVKAIFLNPFGRIASILQIWDTLTLSEPVPLKIYTLPYWFNPPFLIFDIQALWRSELSARVPECQKLKMVG